MGFLVGSDSVDEILVSCVWIENLGTSLSDIFAGKTVSRSIWDIEFVFEFFEAEEECVSVLDARIGLDSFLSGFKFYEAIDMLIAESLISKYFDSPR